MFRIQNLLMLFIIAKCKAAEVLCHLKASKASCQNKIMVILARSGELVMRSTVAFKKYNRFQLSPFSFFVCVPISSQVQHWDYRCVCYVTLPPILHGFPGSELRSLRL